MRSTRAERGRVTAASLVLAAVLLLSTYGIAYAHATLLSAEPVANSRLGTSPTRVRLVFNEELEAGLAHVELAAANGVVTRLVVSPDPHDVRALVAPVAPLAPGAYRVVWHIVSADGHPVEGSYVFRVAVDSAVVAPVLPADAEEPAAWGPAIAGAPVGPALLRGLAMAALMALVGVLGFASWPGVASQPRVSALAKWLSVAAPMLLALHLLAWLVNAAPQHRLTGQTFTAGLASDVGHIELWRVGAALLAMWALWLARRERLAFFLALLAVSLSGSTGHAAALHSGIAIPVKTLHLIAGAAWMGGLLWLAARERKDPHVFAADASRVSAVALASILLVAASGIVQELLFLPSPLDLFRSAYGAVSLAKLAGLLVLAGFGAYHRYRVMPRLLSEPAAPARFAVTLRREIVVIVTVALLGGLLAYTPPPASPQPMSRMHVPSTPSLSTP